jgi:lysophospholipase L1-like esterase
LYLAQPFASIRIRSDGASKWTVVQSTPLSPQVSLESFFRKLANASSSVVNVMYLGDSISEGQGSVSNATLTGRWIQRFNDELRRVAQPAGVPGGRGYVPAYYDINSTTYPAATVGFARSGTITLDAVKGLGRRAAQLGASGTLTITVTCTSFDVVFRRDTGGNSGVFSVVVDSGSATNIDTTSSPYTHGGYKQRFTPSARGRHTIVITQVSGAPIVEGIMIYDGDESSGIHLWDCAKSGYTANSFAANATVWESMYAALPDLVVCALGTNDFRTNRTPAQFSTSINSIITSIRSQTSPGGSAIDSNMPILLVLPEEPNDGSYTYSWGQYRDVLATIAATSSNIAFIDVSPRLTKGQLLDIDNLHPTNAGHQFIAACVAGELLTGWRSAGEAELIMPSPATNMGAISGRYILPGDGSTTTTTYGLGVANWIAHDVKYATTIDQLACEVTTGGSSGSVIRLVVCADDGSGDRPGTLLAQGTIDATGTGVKTAIVLTTIGSGRVWFSGIM